MIVFPAQKMKWWCLNDFVHLEFGSAKFCATDVMFIPQWLRHRPSFLKTGGVQHEGEVDTKVESKSNFSDHNLII